MQPWVRLPKLFQDQAAAHESQEAVSERDTPAMELFGDDTMTATPTPDSIPRPYPAGLVTILAELLQKFMQRQTQTDGGPQTDSEPYVCEVVA